MVLPIRYNPPADSPPVLFVDGTGDVPGLNLSHWPGNTTPSKLKHRLSTGICLNYVSLPEAEQETLAQNASALCNNHFDTDGLLAMFVIQNPKVALAHQNKLLDWATAGDFFLVPNEQAFAFDHLVQAFADPSRSPIRTKLQGCDDTGRYRVVTEHMIAELPAWLENGFEEHQPLYAQALDRLRRDQALLEAHPPVPLVTSTPPFGP